MKKINFSLSEMEGDYRLIVDSLESVLFSACIEKMKLSVSGVPLMDSEVEEIERVRGLLEDMRRQVSVE